MKPVLFFILLCLLAAGTWAGAAVFRSFGGGSGSAPRVPQAARCHADYYDEKLGLLVHVAEGACIEPRTLASPVNDAESIAARTRAIVAAFEREEEAEAPVFYKDVILPKIEAHLAALPDMLAVGALNPDAVSTVLVPWPKDKTRTLRKKVCALIQQRGFECIEPTNAALDLFVTWETDPLIQSFN
jgi:hypothetical protein